MTFPLPGANWTYLHTPRLVATAGLAGFALQNATPTILSWTAPADGALHRFSVYASMHVTSAETGGIVQAVFTLPDGSAGFYTVLPGGQGTGFNSSQVNLATIVKAGTTVTLQQVTALTAGGAKLWAEIWAN